MEDDPQLKARLQTWQVHLPEEPTFRPQVWQRLQQPTSLGEALLEVLHAHRRTTLSVLTATVVTASLFGVLAGRHNAQAARTEQLDRYLASIDPRAFAAKE